MSNQTIFALSSGRPPSGVAVIRISGEATKAIVETIAGGLPEARVATLRKLRAPDGDVIDHGLVLWFQGPSSFTGEDCAEFHLHGGPAVVARMLEVLGAWPGCRMAEAGEFSRRAFLNGKFDLTEIEAIGDLVSAETETQRKLALQSASGQNRALYERWRANLLRASAMIAADVDFSDEEDVPGSVAFAAVSIAADLETEISGHIQSFSASEIIRDGLRVVIAGAPNAGKSTLLNTLAGREAAIVTEVPGTTRDIVEVILQIGGIKLVVSDTAGLRQSDDRVEQLGIEKAKDAVRFAHLVLWLSVDGHRDVIDDDLQDTSATVWRVRSMADLGKVGDQATEFAISSHSGEGISELLGALEHFATGSIGNLDDGLIVARQRHLLLLQEAVTSLRRFPKSFADASEFGAEELRMAAQALGGITGAIGAEDILGEVFSAFCIGK
jgi:tRNA modification GTPase